ncbi:polysaccharide transporter, PST family [Carnobacterium alterfunditum]|uniref:Polysaccharide transporter, PST family n=1 Tax=Carnobacterium alterfunditum TaxID=28230 RepID=A0A1N6HJ68_9LACT|nr:lipopolysaccharide biosynthesis protein [Carnobacterium alterfunditum]SIO19841.1 polysaccharide transporter, PST family [Carnobacterium alterfunditum]
MAMSDFKSGIRYSAIGKYSNVIIQLLVNAVLSRILSPGDYGIVAIVQIFLAFFTLLADMGFGPAIIQNKTLKDTEISVIFQFSIYAAILLGIAFTFLGYPVSLFYDNTVYVPIFVILGISVFFYALLVVPKAILEKKKDFKSVNVVVIISGIVKGIVSIILAVMGFKYYSIIIGGIVQAIINFAYYYYKTRISPFEKFKWDPIKKIWQFSKNQFSFNFINYFSRNLDSILIGKFLDPIQLAFYNKSYQISLYPNQLLAGIITPVIQPIMSDYQEEKDVIEKVYLKITRILANIGIPVSVFCFFAAEEIILFIFGNQWGDSVLTFRILSVSIWLQMIASTTGAFYQSSNRTDLLLFSGIQSMILNALFIIYGIMNGTIESVAYMIVISFTVNFLVNNYLLMYKVFGSGFSKLVTTLKKPVVLGILQLIAFLLLPDLNFSIFITLVIQVIVFVITFLIGLLVTGQLKEMKKLIVK